jgi:hypothetical protein
MIEILTTVFGGPIVGVLGSVVSGVVGYFEKQQQIESDRVRFAHEAHLLEKHIAARGQELESERDIAAISADASMLRGSYRHDASYGDTGPIVNSILRLVRPILTIALIGLVAALVIAQDQTLDRQGIALKVLFLCEVAITWWFADRRRSRR